MWSGGGDYKKFCSICGKQILMTKDTRTHAWRAVELQTGNRHICQRNFYKQEIVENESRYQYLLKKDFLTPAEMQEYEKIIMDMKKKTGNK